MVDREVKRVLPLIILLVVVAVFAFVGYQVYLWSNKVADSAGKKMEKKHVSFTKDGMKVEYKQVNDEDYASAQQSYLVKAWNYSSLPNYKSRFWNKDEQARQAALAKQGKASGSDAAAR